MQNVEPKSPQHLDCHFHASQEREEPSAADKIHDCIPRLRRLVVQLQQEIDSLDHKVALKGAGFAEAVRQFEKNLICAALSRTSGNQRHAAKFLGINRTTLHEKIKRYRIVSSTYRSLTGDEGLPKNT